MKRAYITNILLVLMMLALPALGITKHAIILVMDGARYTETMGDSTYAYIPKIAALAEQGAVLTNFRTAKAGSIAHRYTETNAGHARLTTGTYQNIRNDGTEYPSVPSIFQWYREQKFTDSTSAWVVCSKDKLHILANTADTTWKNYFRPIVDCGVNGNGTGGYREDSVTHKIAEEKLRKYRPAVMLINYKGPDAMGHANNWKGYLSAIQEVDGYALDIWNTIQNDDSLKNTTALFILNDHGRHTSDFTSHGDTCGGCTHLMCVALGPDIKKGVVSKVLREQIDIVPTIAQMLGIMVPTATGSVMSEIIGDAKSSLPRDRLPRPLPVKTSR